MKSAERERTGAVTKGFTDAISHLASCPLAERHDQDRGRRHATGHQPAKALGDHRCLAGSGAGNHSYGTLELAGRGHLF